MKYSQDNTGISMGGLLLGAIAGAVAGVLLAPKSGKETRDELKDILTRVKDDVALKVSELKEVNRESFTNIVDKVIDAYKEAKSLTVAEAAGIKSALSKGYEEIKNAATQARQDSNEPKPH